MTDKIKIMQLLTPLTVAGAERVVLMLENYLDKNLFDLSLCLFLNSEVPDNPFVDETEKSNIKVRKIFFNKAYEWRQVKELLSILKKEKVDILHTHSHRADILGYIANIFYNAKVISTLHGFTPVNMKIKMYEMIEIFFLRQFDSVIAVSQDIQKELINRKINPSKVALVQNALDFSYCSLNADGLSFKTEFGIGREDVLIGTVARLSNEKGLKYLLHAAKVITSKKRNVKFVIVGDGPEKNNLLKLRNELSLDKNIIFTGYRADVNSIYEALDIFVLPSLTEGLPISLLEAAYFKKPIIATRVGEIPKMFGDYIYLIDPGNEAEIVEKILYLLDNYETAKEYGDRVNEFVRDKCSPQKWAITMQDIYRKLIGK